MKLLLSCVFVLLLNLAFAQVTEITPEPEMPGTVFKNDLPRSPGRNDSLIKVMKKYLELRNESSGVINLSQDNMPCIVPNMQFQAPMPNAWKSDSLYRREPGTIPNPSRPIRPLVIPITLQGQSAND
jgi:hypothetical protein